jgi:hypothetical protein
MNPDAFEALFALVEEHSAKPSILACHALPPSRSMREPSSAVHLPIVLLTTSIHDMSTMSRAALEHPAQPRQGTVHHGARLLRPCTSSASPDDVGPTPERVPPRGLAGAGEKTG